ncbi:hypothetical protein BW686_19785 [Pseudomonas syringae]|uniref:Uncharacterized protein n=1 Tax=Pseudomonas syringae TaxID=317 RepID=A0A244EMA2_PSESX|nr:hypothetical protein [Pseudomonas syringae]OUM05602.1 hypothetical protein BW686_19785 [Pseudomonas syringae]
MNENADNAAYLGDIPSLVTFLPGLSSPDQSDIQSALLDAQLFASRQFDFKTQWNSWMHYYRNRLKARGVQEKGVVLGDSLVVSNVEDLMQATFNITSGPGRERLGAMVQRGFQAMAVHQAAESYFKHGFDQGRLGSFQIVPCEKYDATRTLMLLCSLHLSVDEYSGGGRRLLFHFKGGIYTFDSRAYERHREDVTRYLGGKAQSLIRSACI